MITQPHPRAVELVDVTHHFGGRPVLKHVTLAVDAGERVALVGPNGMGKSTLLAVMAGVFAPVSGDVWIDGARRRASDKDELHARRRVAYLPAEAWLPARRTGIDWILTVGRTWGVDDDRLVDHADRLLELFDLVEHADRPIADLSTGQRKKLALCGTLATDAPILLLDEPFSGGLDPSGILALKRILQRRDTSGAGAAPTTVVFATPVPELVEELADRIALVKDGRLVAFDTLPALRRTTGSDEAFEALYERLINPLAPARIDRYLEAAR